MSLTTYASMEARIRQMFEAVDRQDSAAFVTFLTPDAAFQFANMPVARGAGAIAMAFEGFCNSIKSLRHEYIDFFDFGDAWVVEQLVHYVDRWDRQHCLPCVNILRLRDEKVADYRIYMDVTPLFTPPAA